MSSIIGICNAAIIKLGERPISDFSDPSNAARACANLWDIARRSEIAKHFWSFATKRVILAQNTQSPAFGFNYSFTIPSDALQVWRVEGDLDYRIEGDTIITNNKECSLVYTYDNKQVATWSPHFVDLMVSRMALDLAYAIPAKSGMIGTQYDLYTRKAAEARSNDSKQDYSYDFGQAESSLVTSRYNNSY